MYRVKDIEHFKATYKDLGFVDSQRILYPKQVERPIDQDHQLRVCIDKKCINVWDHQDKNNQGEIWIETISGKQKGYATCRDDAVEPYIADLIEIGILDHIV